ncbi:O-antigen ligase [uncultured Acidaminococcus sp.]|uniref:O-antigen ligase family protein n=1 Tax=uncultured Acidaminococcus sp. TaxID=352152 RepID=UPI00262C9708|nr:O-antigen ligase family protein [uncultured Acidaminococcus sp.]
MTEVTQQKIIKALAVCAAGMACITRISMALGEVLNGLVLLLGLILYYYNKKQIHLSPEVKGYLKAYLIFVLCTLPSVIFGGNISKGVHEFLQMWVWRFVVFLPVVVFIKKRDYLINMLTAYMAVFGVDCFLTLIQVLFHLGNNDRGWGLGGSQLGIASIMCMMMPITFIIILDPSFEKRLKNVAKVTLVCNWIGLFCNKSRGSWLSNMILVPVAAWNYVKHSKKALAVIALFFLASGIFMASSPQYQKRFESIANTTTDRSNGDRIEGWKSCIHMVQDYPMKGIGLGRWREFYKPYYKLPTEIQGLNHAHNNYFHLIAETGLVGFAGLLYFTAYFMFRSFKNWIKEHNPADLMIFVAFTGYVFLFGQVEYTLDLSSGVRIFWFLIAIALGLKNQ